MAAVAIGALANVPVASAAPGDFDQSFSGDGKLTTDLGAVTVEEATATAVQSDGKIVAVGSADVAGYWDFGVARYNPDGTRDSSFGGGDGVATTAFQGPASDVVVRPDGRILVAGAADDGVAIASFEPDGDLDQAFSGDGRVSTDLGGDWFPTDVRLALQPDGAVVAAASNGEGSAVARFEPDGDLDPTFSGDGKATTNPDGGFAAGDVAVQANGAIVALGYGGDGDFVLIRYEQDGDLDPTFGGDGVVTTDLGPDNNEANGIAIQPNGAIVAVGAQFGLDSGFRVVRYEPDGDLDPTFSDDGKQLTDFSPFPEGRTVAENVAVGADGTIVASGTADLAFGIVDVAVARFEADGDLDPTFSGDGRQTTDLAGAHEGAAGLSLQLDGRIVVAGGASVATSGQQDMDFSLVRFEADGDLDPTFSGDGILRDTIGRPRFSSAGRAVAIQADGKVVAVGDATFDGTGIDFAVVRYEADGDLDPTFGGGDGMVTTDFAGNADSATAVAVRPDGAIVVAGSVRTGPALPYYNASNYDFGIARYQPDGDLDPTFSGDGRQAAGVQGSATDVALRDDGAAVVVGSGSVARFEPDGDLDPAFSGDGRLTLSGATGVAIQDDGGIVVAGTSFVSGTFNDFAVARLEPDGDLDPTFSGDGQQTTDFAGSFDSANDVVLQEDGKIVVAGAAPALPGGGGVSFDFALARYEPDGDLDPTFSGDGRQKIDFAGDLDEATSVALQPDGAILAAGATFSPGPFGGNDGDMGLLRLTSDGALDPAFSGDGRLAVDSGSFEDGAGLAIQGGERAVLAGLRGEGGFVMTAHRLTSGGSGGGGGEEPPPGGGEDPPGGGGQQPPGGGDQQPPAGGGQEPPAGGQPPAAGGSTGRPAAPAIAGGGAAGSLRVTAKGAVVIPGRSVTCAGAGPGCRVTIAATTVVRTKRGKATKLKLGGASYTVAAGAKANIALKLTGKGMAALRRAGKLGATVDVVVTRGATTVRKTVRLVLRSPAAKKPTGRRG